MSIRGHIRGELSVKRDKDTVEKELYEFVQIIFLLPEICSAQVRNIVITKGTKDELVQEKVKKMVEACYHDYYSDVDLSVNVSINENDTISPLEYMKRIDRFGISQENVLGIVLVEESNMYRIILNNGARYDFGFSFVYDSVSPMLNIQPKEEIDHDKWSMKQVNRFWFVQIQALGKLYRDDYLIADHLANMNINETLVQQMLLRDMKYGTNHHRYGYKEELNYKKFNDCFVNSDDEVFNMIAQKLYSAALAYDELTTAFYPQYEKRSHTLFDIWKCYDEYKSKAKQ